MKYAFKKHFIDTILLSSHNDPVELVLFYMWWTCNITLVSGVQHSYLILTYFAVYNAHFLPKFLRGK